MSGPEIIIAATVSEAIYSAPLSLELLNRLGLNPWGFLKWSFDDFLAKHELERAEFLKLLAELDTRTALAGAKEGLPIYRLLDTLIRDGASMTGQLIPAVEKRLFAGQSRESSNGSSGIAVVSAELKALSQGLESHFREQEKYLFPKLLRYEACIRGLEKNPDFSGGSIQVYHMLWRLKREKTLRQSLGKLKESLDDRRVEETNRGFGRATVSAFHTLMQRVEARIRTEIDILFPEAIKLERNLYNLAVGGWRQ